MPGLTYVLFLGTIVPNMGIIKNQPVEGGLFGKTRSGVLALLYGQPDKSFYLREIVGLLQSGVGAVQRELAALQKLGLIVQEKKGNQSHFRVNSESPIYTEIKGIIQKMAGWQDVLRHAFTKLSGDIQIAFIYGSYASHAQTAASDVDLLVVGNVDEMILHRAITCVEEQIAKTINYTLLNTREFDKRRCEKNGFIARILRGPKISVIGEAP